MICSNVSLKEKINVIEALLIICVTGLCFNQTKNKENYLEENQRRQAGKTDFDSFQLQEYTCKLCLLNFFPPEMLHQEYRQIDNDGSLSSCSI